MKRVIIGGIITLVIGGTGYTISQTDVVNNFAKNTGMSQQQAQKYADDAQKNLVSFTKIGKQLTTDGNLVISEQSKIDCINYKYKWESPSLSCDEGSIELQTIGNNEIQLGKCYEALDTNLGTTANSKISECITDIDATGQRNCGF
jgi:hypothetical protein